MSWFLNSVFAFIGLICIFTILGNGIFSLYITQCKINKEYSKLETFGISLGLGIAIYPTYFYLLDLVGHSNYFFLVIFPTLIGISAKFLGILINKRRTNQRWADLWSRLKISFKNFLNFFKSSRRKHYGNLKPFWSSTAFKIMALIIICIFFAKFANLLNESAVQANFDCYYWIPRISDFQMDPYLNYDNLLAYPFGAVIVGGLFLTLFPETTFSSQFYALKWLPIFILIIYIILLIPIFKRIENKKIACLCIVVTIVFQLYFLVRSMGFVPTVILNIQFEVIVLIFLIGKFPKSILYFILGTMILYHPIYAGFSWILYFGYIFLSFSKTFLKKIKKEQNKSKFLLKECSNLLKPLRELKTYINFLLFIAPLLIYMISMTVRWRPDWINNYLYFFNQYSLDIGSLLLPSPISLDPVFKYFYVLIERFLWLNVSGNIYAVLIIIGLFLNFTKVKSNTTKSKFIQFAQTSAFLSLLILFLPSIIIVLQPLSGIPLINQVLSIINSEFYEFTSERMFEISNVINTFFVVLVLEELFHRFGKYFTISIGSIKKNLIGPHAKKRYEQWYWILFFLQVNAVYTLPFDQVVLYWRVASPKPYIEGILYFRDYLDSRNGTGVNIGYNEGNLNISLLLRELFRNDTRKPFDGLLNTTIIQSEFLENSTSTIDYLVLDQKICSNWIEILDFYSQSNYTLYHNNFMLILIN